MPRKWSAKCVWKLLKVDEEGAIMNKLEYYDNLPDVLTVSELAKYLQIGRNQAYALIQSGAIRSIRIGRAIRIPKSAVIDYLENAG